MESTTRAPFWCLNASQQSMAPESTWAGDDGEAHLGPACFNPGIVCCRVNESPFCFWQGFGCGIICLFLAMCVCTRVCRLTHSCILYIWWCSGESTGSRPMHVDTWRATSLSAGIWFDLIWLQGSGCSILCAAHYYRSSAVSGNFVAGVGSYCMQIAIFIIARFYLHFLQWYSHIATISFPLLRLWQVHHMLSNNMLLFSKLPQISFIIKILWQVHCHMVLPSTLPQISFII